MCTTFAAHSHSILIHCDLLEDHVPEGPESLELIRNEAARLSSFLTDMLMLAKMEHGRLILARSQVNITEMAIAVYDSYSPISQLKQVEFVLDLPPEPVIVAVDQNLWRRVMDNLISNAIKYAYAHTIVTLRICAQNDSSGLTIEVLDEGPGIPDDSRETIFDQFKIIASQRRDVKQVGLGLAFCKMVVDAHKGEIYVSPNKPQGSIFTVKLQ